MILVYSLGGSILAGRDAESLKEYATALKNLAQEHQVFVVVGGGKIAREYIGKARALQAGEAFCDLLGIGATRLNAMLLIAALGRAAAPEPAESYAGALSASAGGRIVVLGGMAPGQTTDAVAALLAEYVGADRLIVATSVDGVYSADPETDPRAVKFDKMTAKDLVSLAMETEMKAGSRSPVDPLAAKIIERSSIFTVVVHGADPKNLKRGAEGGHSGTEISGTEIF